MVGAALGGVGGFYNGLKSTTKLGQTGPLRRTQMLNYIMKQGAARANTLGTIAVLYSGFGVILSWLRGKVFFFIFAIKLDYDIILHSNISDFIIYR